MKKQSYISIICISALSLIAASCSTENIDSPDNTQKPGDSNKEGYYISISAEMEENKSRAHWDIANDDLNTLTYTWDTSTNEMQSFVKRDDRLIGFKDNKLYSSTKVTPHETEKRKTSLEITTSLSNEYQNSDIIWAVSPVSDTHIKTAESSASVEFTLPDGYVQTALSTTEHLKPYVFMTGSGEVKDKTASLSFKVLPAVYRFKITNDDTEVFTLSEVGITGPFCNKVVVGVAGTPEYSVSSTNSSYTIKVTAKNESEATANGINIESGKTAYMYAMVFPTSTSTIEDNVTIFIKGAYGNLPINYSATLPCKQAHGTLNIESNKYYDMPVSVARQDINFGGVTIAGFQEGGSFDVTIDK